MILIFTGNGKGKTTAALGQAVRALGQGKKVCVIQFIKGPWTSGEHIFFKKLPVTGYKLQVIKTGKGFVKILGDKLPFKEHQKAATKGLKIAEQKIRSKKYDLIVLDEINNAVDLKLLSAAAVLKILRPLKKSPSKTTSLQSQDCKDVIDVDIILTGRNAPKSFIKFADLVTEMKEIKHPFQKDKKSAKKGVEY